MEQENLLKSQSPISTEDAAHSIIWPKQARLRRDTTQSKQKPPRGPASDHTNSLDEEPRIDTTAKLALRSKKTKRLQRRLLERESRRVKSEIKSFLDFPHELLIDILSHCLPSDVFTLLRVSKSSRALVFGNESVIAQRVIQQRYWVLGQCFPLPLLVNTVDNDSRRSLFSIKWQDRLKIHRNPYQHIQHVDPWVVCTCMSCVLAWNNLNIILDLAHWQQNLEHRQPLPIIPRGHTPEWNTKLLDHHAQIVKKAMSSPVTYARVLQTHLDTTTRTIVRNSEWRKKGESKLSAKPRLYHLTDKEAAARSDEYLERSGPPSYQPIYMRDNYYSVEAFVPNRKWDKEAQVWRYYSKWPQPHLNDLAWVTARFSGR